MRAWVNYKEIKERISIEDALAHYGVLDTLTERGDRLVGCCPIHKGTNPNQFHASRAKNAFNCFGDCHGGGNVIDFVVMMQGWDKGSQDDVRKAAKLLQEWFGLEFERPKGGRRKQAPEGATPQLIKEKNEQSNDAASASRKEPEQETPAKVNTPLKFSLKHLDPDHPYLTERGLTKETVSHFGAGFCSKGMMANRIAIPIHNEHGELLAYAGRWPGEPPDGEGKYKLPVGFHKSLVVFNLHRARDYAGEGGLIIVEGFMGCMKVHQAGFPNVPPLMGSFLSDEQEALIVAAVGRTGRVALMFDEDDAGWKGREDALSRLARKVFVKVIGLGDEGRQPDKLNEDDIRTLLR